MSTSNAVVVIFLFTLAIIVASNDIENLFGVSINDLLKNEAALQSYATQLETEGYFKVENLLNTDSAQSLSSQMGSSSISRTDVWRNPWQVPTINPEYPEDHPINFMTQAKGGFVGRTDLSQVFIDLYNYKPVLELFRKILLKHTYQSLYLSADFEGSIYGLVGIEGDIGGQHLDQHPFSCVWMLQKPLHNSGEFQYVRYSPVKYESKNGTSFEWDFDLMHQINIKNEDAIRNHRKAISVQNGDVYCFEGNVTMHETTQIKGEIDRILFVTAYHELEGFQHTGAVNDNNKWGKHKVADIEIQSHGEL